MGPFLVIRLVLLPVGSLKLSVKTTQKPILLFLALSPFVSWWLLHYRLPIHQMDVQTAFLHGELDEEIYMQQPPHFLDSNKPSHVCRLHCSLYGLKQAPRQWYYCFHNFMIQVVFTRLHSEPNIYTRSTSAGFAIIGLYVDDLVLLASTLQFTIEAKAEISQAFPMTDGGLLHYCLGMEITQDSIKDTISISQKKYTKEFLARYGMLTCNPSVIPTTVSQRLTLDMCPSTLAEQEAMSNVPYHPSLGSVRYLVTCSLTWKCLVLSNLFSHRCVFCYRHSFPFNAQSR